MSGNKKTFVTPISAYWGTNAKAALSSLSVYYLHSYIVDKGLYCIQVVNVTIWCIIVSSYYLYTVPIQINDACMRDWEGRGYWYIAISRADVNRDIWVFIINFAK